MRPTQTYLWALVGLFARIAPVSVVPLLIRLYSHTEVDWFVLVQTNAALISVVFSFSQANFIQQNYSEENRSELVLFTSVVPICVFLVATLGVFILLADYRTYLYSLLLGLFMSYVSQSQAILRCAGAYSLAIGGDILRVSVFGAFAAILLLYGPLPIESVVFVMGAYYLLPFVIFSIKIVQKASFSEIPRIWRTSVPYLATVTFSVMLSAATLALLRYTLLNHGQPGDLAAYAAIYSIASLSAVAVDFVYVRLGQDIVIGARNRDYTALAAVARKIAQPVVVLSIASLLISVVYATVQFPRSDSSTVLAAVIIVLSFALRSVYIFYQNILVGLKDARSNIVASGFALILVGLAAPYLVAWWPLVGAATVLMLISLTYVVTLGRIVRQLRSKR